jgi:hypothetical protein
MKTDAAADRIEQLEAALRDVIKDFNNEERPLIWQSIATARAALDPSSPPEAST